MNEKKKGNIHQYDSCKKTKSLALAFAIYTRGIHILIFYSYYLSLMKEKLD